MPILFAFLLSTKELLGEIKRLSRVIYSLLSLPAYGNLVLVHFDEESASLRGRFPEDPSGNESYGDEHSAGLGSGEGNRTLSVLRQIGKTTKNLG